MKIDYRLFGDFKRISIDRKNNAAIRGHPLTHEYSYMRNGNPERICSILEIPIHSLTHFDMVQDISLYHANKYFEPQIFGRIAIINLCYKQEIIKEYLFKEKDSLFGDTNFPFLDIDKLRKEYLFCWNKIPGEDNERLLEFIKNYFYIEVIKEAQIEKIEDIDTIKIITGNNSISLKLNEEKTKLLVVIGDGRKDEFDIMIMNGMLNIFKINSDDGQEVLFKILNNLQINIDELEKIFSRIDLENLDGIILRTDWSDFRYGNSELNNPFFEMFHAFLIHPYLNLKVLDFIKNKIPNLKLLGSDTPALTNPLMFVDPNHSMPFIRKVYYKMYGEGIISKDLDIAENFIENKFRYFIKNIGSLNNIQNNDETITIGNMILIPVPILSEPTGMICELYFKRESGSETF